MSTVLTSLASLIFFAILGYVAVAWWPMWIIIAVIWLALLAFVILTRPKKSQP